MDSRLTAASAATKCCFKGLELPLHDTELSFGLRSVSTETETIIMQLDFSEQLHDSTASESPVQYSMLGYRMLASAFGFQCGVCRKDGICAPAPKQRTTTALHNVVEHNNKL